MTAVAYRDGILAADTAVWQGEMYVADVLKIRRLARGKRLFAACGPADVIEECIGYLEAVGDLGSPIPVPEDVFDAILVDENGARSVSARTFRVCGPCRPMMAIGPHAEFLYGAMYAGASAEEAVKLAIQHGSCADGAVQVERIGDG